MEGDGERRAGRCALAPCTGCAEPGTLGPWRAVESVEPELRGADGRRRAGGTGPWRAQGPWRIGVRGNTGPGAHGPGAQRRPQARPRPRSSVRVRVRGSARPGSPPPRPGPVLGCGAQAGRGGRGTAPRPPSGHCRPGAFVSAEAASPPRAGGAQRNAAQGARISAGRARAPPPGRGPEPG